MGRLDNAGILRDGTLANMSEEEWDAVIRVHLKGHATSSLAGLIGNFGQTNYSSAKLAVVAFSRVVAMEYGRYGVRSNAVSPSALTRLALAVPGADAELRLPPPGVFDPLDPANVLPLIAWLAQADCPATSQIFHIGGNRVFLFTMPTISARLETRGRWTLEALDRELPGRLVRPMALGGLLGDT